MCNHAAQAASRRTIGLLACRRDPSRTPRGASPLCPPSQTPRRIPRERIAEAILARRPDPRPLTPDPEVFHA